MATAARSASNPLDGVASLLQVLGGEKTSTTSNPGDTSYLQQVFSQMQGNDPNALLASIFQKAGGQIPGMQVALGNAVGARSGNNSPVAALLQKLLMDTSIAAQDQISKQTMQNQANMGNVGANIATATKGTQQNQKTGTDMGKAIQALMLMQAAGKLGITDKLMGLTGVGGTGGAATTTASAPAMTGGNVSQVQSAPAAISSPVSASSLSGLALPAIGSTIDTGLLNQPGMGSMDWTGGATLMDGFSTFSDMFADQANNLAVMEGIDPMDALMATTDGFGTIPEGGSSFLDSITDVGSSLFDWLGFADGGLVGRDGSKITSEDDAEEAAQKRFDPGHTNNQAMALLQALLAPQAYADGGRVTGPTRGPQRTNTTQTANPMMSAVNLPMQAPAQQMQQRPATDPAMGGAMPGTIGSTTTGVSLQELAGVGPDTGVNSSGQTASPAGLAAVNAALGIIGGMAGSMGGSALAGGLGLGQLGGLALSTLGRGFVNNAITANNAATGGFNSTAGISAGEPGVANDFGAISQGVTGNDIGPGIDLGFLGADSGAGVGAGGGNGGDAASVGVGAGDASSSDAGFGGTLANGGEISGPGTGTSDSILALVSDGEYVVSADVVDEIGVDFFDMLQQQYHTPVANRGRA